MNGKSLVKKLKKTTWEKEEMTRKLVQDKKKEVQHQQTTRAKEEHKKREQVPHLGILNPPKILPKINHFWFTHYRLHRGTVQNIGKMPIN